jgi:type II secretory ATPase GspE/PulE/Tfp pilus assembly ATPase PilB-like protein
LRVLRKLQRPKLHELKLPIEAERLLRKALTEKSGLIVIAGATGSGKTTTIHALLSEMDSTKLNIMSLEDPVEYRFNGLSQVQISKHITFATGLRALLRQDPDVIFVGECRDSETAQLALEAAGTGHLVLTTVHTGSVEDIPKRFEKLGCDRKTLGKAVNLSAFQKLIPEKDTQRLHFEWRI